MTSFTGLFNNAALMLILCVIYDTFAVHAIANRPLRSFITGSLVGIIAIIAMLNPWSLQPGVFFDTRWVLLSLCGLFFELEATLIAVVIAGLFRLSQGGAGGVVGTVVIVVTAAVGVLWKYGRRKSGKLPGWLELYSFGVIVQLAMLSCMSLMPAHLRMTIIKAIAPPILTIFPVLTMIVGLILKKQELRRETERELEANRKALSRERGLLRGVISAVPDLIFFKNTNGTYLGCNTSFEQYAGCSEQELVGRSDLDIFDNRNAGYLMAKDREAFSAEELRKIEEWIVYPDGRQALLDTYRSPFHDQDGNIQGLVGIGRDITERKRSEEQLAAERERLAVTLRSIGDGVITTDVKGEVQMINTVAEQLTGWMQDEVSGKKIDEIFHIVDAQTRKLRDNPIEQAIGLGQIVEIAKDTILVARDGSERRIADSAAPIRDTQEKIIGAVLVFRDVTAQVRTELELFRVKQLQSIGILAGGIAHDFNNILTAIMGNINLATLDPTLSPRSRSLLQNAEKASVRAKSLAKQLLTFSKGGSPIKEVCQLKDIIVESADFVLHGGNVSCSYSIADDLWLADIDRGQIGQVIQNVVLNAIQAMPAGGAISIHGENCDSCSSLSVQEDASFVVGTRTIKIVVRDEGHGIPQEIQGEIFEPYFSTKREGSGLGLSIAHSIIKKHGGTISVQSERGKGTSLTIHLPAAIREEQPCQEIEEIAGEPVQARVLVMDDESMVRTVIREMLAELGPEVTLATDGDEAISLYQEAMVSGQRFDLVIMDLTIPGGMGGKEAVQQILRLDPEAKVVVSSGYSEDPIMADCQNYGFCAAIEKPYRLQDLAAIIHQFSPVVERY